MKRWVRPLQWACSLLILWLLYRKLPFYEVRHALGFTTASAVAMAGLLAFLIQVINARRLQILTDQQGFRLGAGKLLEINLASLFYKFFLPGGLLASITVRYYKLLQAESNKAGVLSSVVVDRMCSMVGLCLVGAIFWCLDQSSTGTVGWVAVALLGLCAALLLRGGGRLARVIADAIPFPLGSRKMHTWLDSLAAFRRLPLRQVFWLILLSITPHLIGILIYRILAMSLGVSIGLMTWGWMRSAIILGTMLPISVSGLGVRDGMMLFLLHTYGVSGEQVLALAFLVFGVTVLFVALLGALLESRVLFRSGRARKVEHYDS